MIKDECATKLRSYCLTYGKPSIARSNNDSVFKGPLSEWKKMRLDLGVVADGDHSVFYHPETDGKLERASGTLQSAIPTNLTFVDVRFWDNCFQFCTHVWNPVPKMRRKSPYELPYGRRAPIKCFKKFGCPCFAKKQKPGPFRDKSTPLVFLG